jgi:hypothetical protein
MTRTGFEKSIGDLREPVTLKCDGRRWITAYRDAEDQIWIEFFRAVGHGSVGHLVPLEDYLTEIDPAFDYQGWIQEGSSNE